MGLLPMLLLLHPGAGVISQTGGGVSAGTIAAVEEALVSITRVLGRVSLWSLPLILNGDAAADIPADTPQPANLYLYRNMRSMGSMPQLGNSANTLGVRNTDFSTNIFGQLKTDIDYVYGSSGEGMSTTPGYGNVIPFVRYGSSSTTLFRIKATDVYRSGLGINVDGINHANIIPSGRTTLQQFRLQVQATAPLWKPIR